MEKQDLDHCEKNMVVKNECFLCKASNCNEYKPSPCKCFESCKKCGKLLLRMLYLQAF